MVQRRELRDDRNLSGNPVKVRASKKRSMKSGGGPRGRRGKSQVPDTNERKLPRRCLKKRTTGGSQLREKRQDRSKLIKKVGLNLTGREGKRVPLGQSISKVHWDEGGEPTKKERRKKVWSDKWKTRNKVKMVFREEAAQQFEIKLAVR